MVGLLRPPGAASDKAALSAAQQRQGGDGDTAGPEGAGVCLVPTATVKAGPLSTQPGTFRSAQRAPSGHGQPPSASANSHAASPGFPTRCQRGRAPAQG